LERLTPLGLDSGSGLGFAGGVDGIRVCKASTSLLTSAIVCAQSSGFTGAPESGSLLVDIADDKVHFERELRMVVIECFESEGGGIYALLTLHDAGSHSA
jgi:hypothetical protein